MEVKVTTKELVFSATKKDFKLDWFSGTGGGGQHRNKHPNCLRITHIPTGLTAQSTKHKERPANQKEAFRLLVAKLVEHVKQEIQKNRIDNKNDEVIRTYNEPDNRVKDHASGQMSEFSNIVDKNNLEPMIDARRKAMIDKEDTDA